MKIEHISNSFIVVTTNDVKIVCDPWVGLAQHGGWHSDPNFDRNGLLSIISDADFTYISHLHSDHFSPQTLKEFGLLNSTKFLIKKFENGVLKRRLEKLNASEIIEIDGFERVFITEETSVAIIPQMTVSNSKLPGNINYDLDTSLVVSSEGKTFFNQVDNPLSIKDFEKVKHFIDSEFGDLSIACFSYGAASEYPQCFRGIDRSAERTRILNLSRGHLESRLEVLRPKNFFVAGGTYVVPGRFGCLNEFIALATKSELKEHVSNLTGFIPSNSKVELHTATKHEWRDMNLSVLTNSSGLPYPSDVRYEYEDFRPPELSRFQKIFDQALLNCIRTCNLNEVDFSTTIILRTYIDFCYRDDLTISGEVFGDFIVSEGCADELIVHLDYRALWGCINRRLIWNQVISGSLALFDRVPNIHKPDDLFLLNFLVVSDRRNMV